MPRSGMSINSKRAREVIRQVERIMGDARPALREFQQSHRVVTHETARRLRRGGDYRGVHWDYFAPQYIRQDGGFVPAWGGVPRVDGKGLVQGRLRPSGQRVHQGDSVMQDTNTLVGRAAASVFKLTGTRIRFGVNLVYARAQFRMRPLLFFSLPEDAQRFARIVREYALRAIRSIGLRGK